MAENCLHKPLWSFQSSCWCCLLQYQAALHREHRISFVDETNCPQLKKSRSVNCSSVAWGTPILAHTAQVCGMNSGVWRLMLGVSGRAGWQLYKIKRLSFQEYSS